MFRITQHKSAAAAKDYYKTHLGQALGDYYGDHAPKQPETIGQIHGRLAERLGMNGTMSQEDFFDLIDNINPRTKQRLTQRTNGDGNRRVGFDLYFDYGKSLSTYYARTRDPLVPRLFDETVNEVMENEVEKRMRVRVRQGGEHGSRLAPEALWTSFNHLTTRPTRVKDPDTGKWIETGTTDPHGHQHVYLMNAAWDAKYRNRDGSNGAVLAAEITDGIWTHADYLQQNFHARLAKKLRDAGFNVRRNEHGSVDLVGWNEELDRSFSRRTREIEAKAKERNISRPEDKAKLGRSTRTSKHGLKLSMDEQFDEWRSRVSEATWDEFLESATGEDSGNWPEVSEKQAIDYALAHTAERDNSSTLEEVMHAAIDRGFGSVDVDKLHQELLARDDVILARVSNETFVTTKDMLRLEQKVVDWATRGQGTRLPLAAKDLQRESRVGNQVQLNDGQRSALNTLLTSTSKLTTLRGAPGVGKTTVMSHLVRHVEAAGGNVVGLGTTSNARDELQEAGLADAMTLAKFLDDAKQQQRLTGNSLIILDEATLAGLKDLHRLTEIIDKHASRLLLVGDYRQLQSVPRNGKIFENLHHSIKPAAELIEIVRQHDHDYRQAVKLFSDDDQSKRNAGFEKLQRLGFVKEFDKARDRTDQAAKLYLDITGQKAGNRGTKLDWTETEKKNPEMYRSGMTVIIGKGKSAVKREVVGRKDGHVMIMEVGGNPNDAKPLRLDDVWNVQVYEANYTDAMVVVGTHREGERVAKRVRELQRRAGELGIEHTFTTLESVGFSGQEKAWADRYKPGMLLEFGCKSTAFVVGDESRKRSIWYGERFKFAGHDDKGRAVMESDKGEQLIAPLANPDRFDVFTEKRRRIAVGESIRMTQNGYTLPNDGQKKGSRFSNNDVFKVSGFDDQGNMIIGKGRVLAKDFGHHRSGVYKTSMAGQGSNASHAIIVDSKEAGRSRSVEHFLVAISRGRRAATLITDDVCQLRNIALSRSSQRHSAIELAAIAGKLSPKATEQQVRRVRQQMSRLKRFGEFARLAADATMNAIERHKERFAETARALGVDPSREPAK